MDLFIHYLSLATKSIFIENILLAFFLGMCSFLAISKNVEASKGIGKAVIFVNGLTVPINWIIKTYLLAPGALYQWIPIESLKDVNGLGEMGFFLVIGESIMENTLSAEAKPD